MYIWSEPSNDGSRPESVVLCLVTVQAVIGGTVVQLIACSM